MLRNFCWEESFLNTSVIKRADGVSLNSDSLFTPNTEKIQTVFKIPAYQRPYVWKQKDWDKLFDDIEGNDAGYFVGAILCVDKGNRDEKDYAVCEVIDGQQRLTTLSLLLTATYSVLDDYSKIAFVKDNGRLAEKINDKKKALKNQLIVEAVNDKFITRVIPQYDDNRDDYFNIIIGTVGIDKADFSKPLKTDSVDTRRQLARAYSYFKKRLENYAVDEDGKNDVDRQIKRIFEFSLKVNSTTVVMITAESESNANMLFEALNNRGVPLTITDLVRNKLLGEIKSASINIGSKLQFGFDYYKDSWNKILGDGLFKSEGKEISSGEQERFFRQSYNACRFDWIQTYPVNKKFTSPGKKANLYDAYSEMINLDPEKTFNQIMDSAKLYLKIQGDDVSEISKNLNSLYKDLNHINGTTSYTLLLYLVKNRDSLKLQETDLENICRSLINFFVRRNITNKPTYNKLDQLFNEFIKEMKDGNYTGEKICSALTQKLQAEVGKDFEKILLNENSYDNIGNENVYFILSKLAEARLHDKTSVDFWAESDKRNPEAWNIEHILPQTLSPEWGKILSAWAEKKSDTRTVEEIQKVYMNKLGNLTLTQYNSELGNKSFIEKRDLTKDDKNIGYKNELYDGLNKGIVNKDNWTPDEIDARTKKLVEEILKIFVW